MATVQAQGDTTTISQTQAQAAVTAAEASNSPPTHQQQQQQPQPIRRSRVPVVTTSLSSLPLEILVYFNSIFRYLWAPLTLIGFIWKGSVLPYSSSILTYELALWLAFVALDSQRTYLGSAANKTENSFGLILFLVLTVLALAGHLFFLLWQVYVLRIDLAINVIGLLFVVLELILGVVTMLGFISH